MTRYLISFDDGAMTFPEEELPEVAEAAHKVVNEAQMAGVWVFGGGVVGQTRASWPLTGRSPMARIRRPRTSSEDSQSSTCPHTTRHWSGLPRSPSPAGVHKRYGYGNSCPARTSDRRPTASTSALSRGMAAQNERRRNRRSRRASGAPIGANVRATERREDDWLYAAKAGWRSRILRVGTVVHVMPHPSRSRRR